MADEKLPTKEQLAELRKLNEQLGKGININNIKKDAAAVAALLDSWKTKIDAVDSSFEDASERFKDSVNFFTKGNEALKDTISATKKLAQLSQDLAADKEEIYEMDSKDLEKTLVKIQKEQLRLKIANKMLDSGSKEYGENEKNLELSNEILKKAQERLALEQHITNQMGITGAAVKATAGIFEKLGVGGFLELDKINEKMREVAKDGGNKMKVLGAGMKEAFRSAGLALRDPVTMLGLAYEGFKKLLSLSIEYQQKQFETAKALGTTVSEGSTLLNHFRELANHSEEMALTSSEIEKTYAGMNESAGFLVKQNDEFLTTATGIERRLGVSAESMQDLQMYASQTGKSLTSTYSTVIGIGKVTAATLKFNMTEKQIIEGISKVSATVFNNFKGNVKELTAAVVTATKFGTTLDTISQQGNSLLDFESSISKEFEAQLLTGKDLNLSKARELALNHDTDGLMKELNSKMMTYTEYNKMNVLQQQSFAEALGLSKEQMDEIYKKQQLAALIGDDASKSTQTQYEALRKQGKSYDDIAKVIGDAAAGDAKRADLQELQAAATEKMKDAIGESTQKLSTLVTQVAEFFSHTENIKIAMEAIGALFIGFITYSLILSAKKKEEAALQTKVLILQKEQLISKRAELLAEQKLIVNKEAETVVSTENNVISEEGAGLNIVGAMAKAFESLGPIGGAVASAAIAATLFGLLSSFGGSSESPSSTSIPSSEPISPMNSAAESAKATGPEKLTDTGKKMERGVSVFVTMDQLTGKKTEKILVHDYGVSSDTSAITNPSTKY